jgi:capsular exopolysaccharide synthesis family protein
MVPSDQSGELRTLTNILLEKAWLIILCLTIGVLVAAYHLKNAPRIYQATSTVQVEQEEKKIVKVDSFTREDLRSSEMLNTIVQKFGSRSLMERVIETNRLAQDPAFVGQYSGAASKEDLVPALMSMTSVGLRRGTRLIDISVRGTDPKLAANLANSMAEQYMEQDMAASSSSSKGAYSYLKDETERLKKRLEDSQTKLQKYREEAGIVSEQGAQDVLSPQLRELTVRLVQARSDTARIQRALERLKLQVDKATDLGTISVVATNGEVQGIKANVSKMQQDFKILMQRYKQKHPKYIDARTQLEEGQVELSKAMTNALVRAEEWLKLELENSQFLESGLEKELRQVGSEALKMSEHAVQASLMQLEVQADRALFDSVLNRLKESSIASEQQPERLRFIQSAVAPRAPISPNVRRTYAMGIIIGLLAGVVLAFGHNAMDTSFKSIEQAEGYLQLPVLTAIPRLKEVREGNSRFVAAEGSTSRGAESFRTLRTSLSMLGQESDRRTFLFTSAFPQEGKTFSSINFAISLAQQGLKTLLIDVDLRRPSVENYITGRKGQLSGVTDLLVGEKKLSEVLQVNHELPNLQWIAAGREAPNPAELLAQGTFFKLLDEALKTYDRVVIDSAPIHAVSDTLLIANRIQTCVLVVHGKRTPRKPVQRSVQLLRSAGANMGGVILNLVPSRRARGYYYDTYYYHGYYHHEGKPDEGGDQAGKPAKAEKTQV